MPKDDKFAQEEEEFFKSRGITDEDEKAAFRRKYAYREYETLKDKQKEPEKKKEKSFFKD